MKSGFPIFHTGHIRGRIASFGHTLKFSCSNFIVENPFGRIFNRRFRLSQVSFFYDRCVNRFSIHGNPTFNLIDPLTGLDN